MVMRLKVLALLIATLCQPAYAEEPSGSRFTRCPNFWFVQQPTVVPDPTIKVISTRNAHGRPDVKILRTTVPSDQCSAVPTKAAELSVSIEQDDKDRRQLVSYTDRDAKGKQRLKFVPAP